MGCVLTQECSFSDTQRTNSLRLLYVLTISPDLYCIHTRPSQFAKCILLWPCTASPLHACNVILLTTSVRTQMTLLTRTCMYIQAGCYQNRLCILCVQRAVPTYRIKINNNIINIMRAIWCLKRTAVTTVVCMNLHSPTVKYSAARRYYMITMLFVCAYNNNVHSHIHTAIALHHHTFEISFSCPFGLIYTILWSEDSLRGWFIHAGIFLR